MAAPTAAGILFVHDRRVLLLKRAESAQDAPGTWSVPGGGIEEGETPEQAARRELQEECDWTYDGPLTPLYVSSNGFQCFGAKGYAEPALNAEHTDWGWFSFDDLPSPLHPGMKELKMPLVGGKLRAQNGQFTTGARGKSDGARSENIRREIKAGKDPKQAAAIAYSVQRKAQHAQDRGADDFLQTVDAIHKCAADCMEVGYDRKRK